MRAFVKENRGFGFFVIALIYLLAMALGLWVFQVLGGSGIFIRVLLADVAATVFVYFAGCLFGNASVYDPYWSVQPIVILLGLALYYGRMDFSILLLLVAVSAWGLRLTVNWAETFQNLNTQDWRYDMFQQRFPRLYPLVNLFGIHLFPTMVVYLALLPAISMMEGGRANLFTVTGFFVCLGAMLLQLIADRQMQRFRRQREAHDDLIRIGLWKHARHPNYLGEILMWWGVYVMMLSITPQNWILGIGALVNTLMFRIVSVPMAERRNSEKPGYAQYCQETRMLLPFPRRDDAV